MDRITIQVPTTYLTNICYKVTENVMKRYINWNEKYRVVNIRMSISIVSLRNKKLNLTHHLDTGK